MGEKTFVDGEVLTAADTNRYLKSSSVRKTADETVNNSATLQNDDHLKIAIGANEDWVFSAFIIYESAATDADFKLAFTVPSGATIRWAVTSNQHGPSGSDPGAPDLITTSGGTDSLNGGGVGNFVVAYVEGIVLNGATAGDIQLQWAQNTAEVSNTRVKQHSYMTAQRH